MKLLFLFKDFFFLNRCLHLTPGRLSAGCAPGSPPPLRRGEREGWGGALPNPSLSSQTPPPFPLSNPAPPHLLLPEGLVLRVDHPDSPFDGQQPSELVVSHHGRCPRPPPPATASARAHPRSAPAAAPLPNLTGGGGATVTTTPLQTQTTPIGY